MRGILPSDRLPAARNFKSAQKKFNNIYKIERAMVDAVRKELTAEFGEAYIVYKDVLYEPKNRKYSYVMQSRVVNKDATWFVYAKYLLTNSDEIAMFAAMVDQKKG